MCSIAGYEPCGQCGYDHSYEQQEAYEAHLVDFIEIEKRYMENFRYDAPEQLLNSKIVQKSWQHQVNLAIAELETLIEEGYDIDSSVETIEQKLIQGKYPQL